MYVYGVVDHGGGPTRDDIEKVGKINRSNILPEMIFSSTESFFKDFSQQKIKLLILKTELNPIFDGCYTSASSMKINNANSERLLINAEKLSCISYIIGDEYKALELEESWKIVLFNQFHDILAGSSGRECNRTSNNETIENQYTLNKIIEDNLESVSNRVKLQGNGSPIMVFNSLSWPRTSIVKMTVPDHDFSKRIIIGSDHNLINFITGYWVVNSCIIC